MNASNRLKRGLAGALIAAVVAAFAAAPASADTGGTPNVNAGSNPCLGDTVSFYVPGVGLKETAGGIGSGLTPKEALEIVRTCRG